MAVLNGYLEVACCGKRRGFIPTAGQKEQGKILICSTCDFAHDDAGGPPCEDKMKDMPLSQRYVNFPELRGE